MQRIIKTVNRGREYIYSTPTKAMELLNGLFSSFFCLVFLINGDTLSGFRIYINFNYLGPKWFWIFMLFIGLAQLNYMRKDTLESNIKSALVMHISSVNWLVVAIMFGSIYPPLSTGFFTYSWFSVISCLTALHLDSQNTYELLIRKEIKDA